MATKKWFVVTGDNEMGPLGPNGLRKLVRSGEVRRDTKVRREDQQVPVLADQLRGLFPDEAAHGPAHPKVHGPFTSLRVLGRSTAAAMGVWVVIGAWGAYTAWSQRATAMQLAGNGSGSLLDAGAPFLGLGGVVGAVLFCTTGVLFVYWLWCARMNVPHLVQARIHYGPSWVVAGWLVPILNLLRPYQVIEEVDRLSAEAAADGDAAVGADSSLLVPWWLSTLLIVGLAGTYVCMPVATAEDIATSALLHLGAGITVALAAGLAATVVLRISWLQEDAHDRHAEPVRVHHELGRKHDGAAGR